MLKLVLAGVPIALAGGTGVASAEIAAARWTAGQARAWSTRVGWLSGCNYVPANAVNQIEMFAAESFDPATIQTEFGWARGLGLNCVRVFLHDLLWAEDSAGYTARINTFLSIAASNGIATMPVLFDSCWNPDPALGPQGDPIPGVHNSRWVQSPGAAALLDDSQIPRLREYVTGVVSAFAADPRIIAWDIWNEPDNVAPQYRSTPGKIDRVVELLPQAFSWARAARPIQPLTSATWEETTSAVSAIQLAQSDIYTFHNYHGSSDFLTGANELAEDGRPVLCTEFLARSRGSTIEDVVPAAKSAHVGVMTWGLVNGRSQTHLPWDSWQRPYVDGHEPAVWFHDLLRPDGTPYDAAEAAVMREAAGISTALNERVAVGQLD